MFTARGGKIRQLFDCRRLKILALACSVIALTTFDAANAENLNDAMAQAYSYSPQLDAERARLRATDEDVARANSGYRPDIRASADVGHEHTYTRPSSFNNGSTSPKGYAVQLVQPIFRGFQVTNAVNAAEASVRAGREQLRSVEQQVLLDAVTAYGNVVANQAIVRLRENNLNFLSTELKATKDRFTVGEVTKTDVSQAEARLALGQSDLDLARANLNSFRAIYLQVVGSPPKNLSEPNLHSKLLPGSLDEAVAIGTRENPAVVGWLYSEHAALFQVDVISCELLPDASMEVYYSDRFGYSRWLD